MQPITRQDCEAAARMFNMVENNVQYYHVRHTAHTVRKFISPNKWLMFPLSFITSMADGKASPTPNVFLAFTGALNCDGAGIPLGAELGFTYNNVGAMDWFRSRIRRNIDLFTQLLDATWSVSIQHKIKIKHEDYPPVYNIIREQRFTPEAVTEQWIRESLEIAEAMVLPAGSEYNQHDQVLWCVPIVVVYKTVTPRTYPQDVQNIFNVLRGV